MKEIKRDRFVRVAEARTNKILQHIRLVGNLSNKGIYDYSEDDVEQIFGAIESELSKARERFENSKKGKKAFSLSDQDDAESLSENE